MTDLSPALKYLLNELEVQLQQALKELKRLRQAVHQLEEENRRLRKIFWAATGEEGRWQQLKLLYEEGYHICPPFFAQERSSEGCLFCLALLEREGE
ncbi:MAG TPA: DUF972 family protein [Moorella mulderi]|nr:DUF972 family protein [Moorella mulderi]